MFKNITLFRSNRQVTLPDSAPRFVPCEPSQAQSFGFVPPRDEGGPITEVVGGHRLMAVTIETKRVPAEAIKRRVAELAEAHERETGRKPGRKVKLAMRERALQEMLPRAFARRMTVPVWSAPDGLLVIGSTSAAVVDTVMTLLVTLVDGLAVQALRAVESPSAVMADWLVSGEPPQAFAIDRECVLKGEDEMKSAVRYSRHPLDIDEVREHIAQGKEPQRLAVTWTGRVSFVLFADATLRGIKMLDGVLDSDGSECDRFDADAAIVTGLLSELIPDLMAAMGGEQPVIAA